MWVISNALGHLLCLKKVIPVWHGCTVLLLFKTICLLWPRFLHFCRQRHDFSPPDVSGQQRLDLRSWPSCIVPFDCRGEEPIYVKLERHSLNRGGGLTTLLITHLQYSAESLILRLLPKCYSHGWLQFLPKLYVRYSLLLKYNQTFRKSMSVSSLPRTWSFLRLDCFVSGSVCLTAAYFQNVLTDIK